MLIHGRWARDIDRSCWQGLLTKVRRLLFVEGADRMFLNQNFQSPLQAMTLITQGAVYRITILI
jgi:hypothetical protein